MVRLPCFSAEIKISSSYEILLAVDYFSGKRSLFSRPVNSFFTHRDTRWTPRIFCVEKIGSNKVATKKWIPILSFTSIAWPRRTNFRSSTLRDMRIHMYPGMSLGFPRKMDNNYLWQFFRLPVSDGFCHPTSGFPNLSLISATCRKRHSGLSEYFRTIFLHFHLTPYGF